MNAVAELSHYGSLIWNRHLSNTAGGNLSIRADSDSCYMTRSRNNRDQQWEITEESVLRVGLDGTILEGVGQVSREFGIHLGLYSRFAGVGAVIHAHPQYGTAYAALGKPLSPVLESLDKFGDIPCVSNKLASLTPEFAQAGLDLFEAAADKVETIGYGIIYPRHGITTAGPSMVDAFDLLDRIEDNAMAAFWTQSAGATVTTPASFE
jgi:L-fuculose-phosphate aldolase